MSKRRQHLIREVSVEVFVDKDSDFHPDIADSYQIKASKWAKLVGLHFLHCVCVWVC